MRRHCLALPPCAAFLQAYVFAILTCINLNDALRGGTELLDRQVDFQNLDQLIGTQKGPTGTSMPQGELLGF